MRLRQGLSAALAVLLGALFVTGCDIKNTAEANAIAIDLGTIIGTKDTTLGNCAYEMKVGTSGSVKNGGFELQVGEERDVRAYVSSKCPVTEDFQWTSSAPNVVSVVRVDSTTGRTKGISPGTSIICAIWTPNQNLKFCFPVTVPGSPTSLTIGPSGQSIDACGNVPHTLQLVVGPAGTVGTYTVSGIVGATVSASGLLSVPTGSSGTALVTFTSTSGQSVSLAVAITANCGGGNPSISFSPASITLNFGSGCPAASAVITVTTTGVANPSIVNLASSNTSVASATLGGMQITVNAVGGGTTNITGSISGYSNLTFSVPVTITTNACGSGALITFSPPTVCLSTVTGSTSAQVTVNASGMPAGTAVSVVSGNPGLVTVSPATISAPSGVVTLTRVSTPTANQNVTITASGGGTQNAMNAAVVITSCGSSTIDYTPPGGLLNFTSSTLTAIVVIGSDNLIAPKPFWTSNHPELVTVVGNESQPVVIGGINYYWGMTATVTKIANIPSGRQVEICVQWYPDFGANPKACHIWTAP